MPLVRVFKCMSDRGLNSTVKFAIQYAALGLTAELQPASVRSTCMEKQSQCQKRKNEILLRLYYGIRTYFVVRKLKNQQTRSVMFTAIFLELIMQQRLAATDVRTYYIFRPCGS